ncbi:MAG: dTDP-4-dehydrorhamnose 3,5-epimerase [Prevotella sp.]|nr:dTDP-4-dehydrorhamnose 3,5-epimerase [Prevotella sp.]MCM1074943.1 dTDP-4-dehydrorhamnose 3,5-epimerase [Ruminococcus sp.]
MEYIETEIAGLVIVKPKIFRDTRGYFMETFRHDEFLSHIGEIDFVQDNESASTGGVVRGLHFQQMPHSQSKLVRCIVGKVLDVAVDLREGSPTFGKHVSVVLVAEQGTQFFIPRGFAHGYSVLSDYAVFQYKCDAYYHPEAEGGINPFDPALGIDWGIKCEQAILSEKDLAHPCLAEMKNTLTFNGNLYGRI